jgi:Atypical Arm repeat
METTIQLQKKKQHEVLKRSRGGSNPLTAADAMIVSNPTDSTADIDLSDDEVFEYTNSKAVGGKKKKLNTIDETVLMVMTRLRETAQQYNQNASGRRIDEFVEVVRDIRRLSSNSENPPIGKLLAHGLLPYLLSVIQHHSNPIILHEAIGCLINVTSSSVQSHVEAVVYSSAVSDIVKLLVHDNTGVCEQAIWFVANIAGENDRYRNALLGMSEVVEGLLRHVSHPDNISILSSCAWAISNLFRGQPSDAIPIGSRFVPYLVRSTKIGVNGRVQASELVYLMNALFHITECGPEASTLILEHGMLGILISAIQHYSEQPNATLLLIPIVRLLWQFSSGTEHQTDQVVQSGFLKYALKLLRLRKEGIQRYVLLTLSNIAAGTFDQINSLVQRRVLIKEIVLLAKHSSAKVRKEALWTLSNIVTEGSLKQANFLVAHDCISTFCHFLETPSDSKLVLVVLEAVEKLLLNNKGTELGYVSIFECSNVLQILEDLQLSHNEEIYEAAVRIIVNYFDGVEEDELSDSQNIAPLVSDGDTTFEFGINALPAKQLFPDNEEMRSSSDPMLVTKHMYNFGNATMNHVYHR